jgi:hypothetical protein
MQYQKLPSFNGVALGSRASVQIPSYAMSVGRIVLQLGGGLTKALISEIVVKIGSRVVFGPVSGTQLDTINKFRDQFDHASFITIDLTEKNALSIVAKEIGAIDIPALRGEPIFVEVVNTQGAGTPTLVGYVGFTGLQFAPGEGKNDKMAGNDRQEQLIHKLLRYVVPNNGATRQSWMPNFGGAQIKRIHFFYTGTDWTTSANGNLYQVECKKNGIAVHDRVECLANRFVQQEQKKVPQSRVYTLDFVHDNVMSAMLHTRGIKSLEFTLDLTAGDTVTAFVECLDLPRNL